MIWNRIGDPGMMSVCMQLYQEVEWVELKGVDQTGRSCLIDGDTVQRWVVEGWVACNRLLFEEPTTVW